MDQIHKKLWILLQFSLGPRGHIFETKFTISCEFGPLRVKWWYHMFSSRKLEEYIEFGLSGIFRVKLVTKKLVHGCPGPILCIRGLELFLITEKLILVLHFYVDLTMTRRRCFDVKTQLSFQRYFAVYNFQLSLYKNKSAFSINPNSTLSQR